MQMNGIILIPAKQVCKDVLKNSAEEFFPNWPAIAKTFIRQREVFKEMIHVDSSCILVSYGRGLNEKIGWFLSTAHTRPCYNITILNLI